MNYDTLIIGAGAAGMSCALVLGSAQTKDFASSKRVAILTHQKSSHLQNALFNNVLGLPPGTLGSEIMEGGLQHLAALYPHIMQIDAEKAMEIVEHKLGYHVRTNKSQYIAHKVVIAVGYTHLMTIKGLEEYIAPHPRARPEKKRIYLRNEDHLIKKGLYVAGTLAGWRSQYAIACGSGAHVATDILTEWNGGEHTKIHDKAE